jgi:hypothetical protein
MKLVQVLELDLGGVDQLQTLPNYTFFFLVELKDK